MGYRFIPGRALRLALLALPALLIAAAATKGVQPCADYAASTLWLDQQRVWGGEGGSYSKAMLVRAGTLVVGHTSAIALSFLDISDPHVLRTLAATYDFARDGNGGDMRDIAAKGDYLYLCTPDTLRTVAIADPSVRTYASTIGGIGQQAALACGGDLLLLAGDVLRVFDVSQPDSPVPVAALDLGSALLDVELREGVAYAATSQGLVTIDVSDPAAPAVLGRYDRAGMGARAAVAVDGAYAYLTSTELVVLDVSDPAAPSLAACLPGVGGHAIAVAEGYACVAGATDFAVCDVANPLQPRLVRSVGQTEDGFTGGVAIHDGCLFAFVYGGSEASAGVVASFRLSRATPPAPLGQVLWPDVQAGNETAWWLSASGPYVRFVSPAPDHPGAYTLRIVDVGEPAAPVALGQVDVHAHRFVWTADLAYAASGRLEVVGLADPNDPRIIASVPLTAEPDAYWNERATLVGHCLVAHLTGTMGRADVDPIVDVGDPSQPRVVGTLPAWLAGLRLVPAHGLAYALSGHSLLVVDMGDPLAPQLIATVDVQQGSPGNNLTEAGGQLYYTFQDDADDGGYQLRRIDLSDPRAPRPAQRLQIPGPAAGLAGSDRYLLFAGSFAGVHLIDISRPDGLSYAGTLAWMGWGAISMSEDVLALPALGGFTIYPAPCSQAVPTLLSFFTAGARDCAVDLRWALTAPVGGLRLTADAGGQSWPVSFTEAGGTFAARDASPRLAAGGTVVYVLERRDSPDAPWTVLAQRTVELASPARPVELLASRPNPFNPAVTVAFVLDRPQVVKLAVYDLAGRRVARLAEGPLAAGRQEVVWRGEADDGKAAASGSYVLRLESERGRDQRLVTLVR